MPFLQTKLKFQQILFNSVLILFIINPLSLFSQAGCNEEVNFTPNVNSTELTHPTITIKVQVHVIKRYEDDAQNLTEDSIEYVRKQFEWINQFYTHIKQPTIPAQDGKMYHIPDSRVRFRVDSIHFHTDSIDWDRGKAAIGMTGGAPWDVDTINLDNNEIGIKGNWKFRFGNRVDSIRVINAESNTGNYTKIGVRVENNITYIKVKENLSTDVPNGKMTFWTTIDKNCHRDLWEKYTNSNKDYIHVFYTGKSLDKIQGGCGPSPYYLNVHNAIYGGEYAAAQLTAHELGHCLGLRHTNTPQFKDLPATDKFGWIPCNNTNTSNNIMGYNICRKYLSPMQIGFIHKRFSTTPDLLRTTAANEYDTSFNHYIWTDTTWNKAMIVRGDIVVKKRQTLTINCKTYIASEATIFLEKRARLIINGTEVNNAFGEKWQGVTICRSYFRKNRKPRREKNKGKIILENNGLLLNTKE